MTVSHVINEHPNVRATTRDRVIEAISALDYRVNHAARNLRKGRTGTIGLAVPEVDRPYFAQLAAAILTAAKERHLRVAIEQTGGAREGELDALALSRNRLYDGLILSTVGLGASDAELLKVDFPVVLLGERIFDGPVDHVAMANVDASRVATEHLIARGSTRIAMVGGRADHDTAMQPMRTAGYRAALERAGIAFDPALVVELGDYSMRAGVEAAHALSDGRAGIDGAFCVTDTVAVGFLRGLVDRGVRVPEDVRIIGFDNIAETAYTVPTLSTIDPDNEGMAKRAVQLLADRIEGRPTDRRTPVEYVSPFRLIARESSA